MSAEHEASAAGVGAAPPWESGGGRCSPLLHVAEEVTMLPLRAAAVAGLHEVHKHLGVLVFFFLQGKNTRVQFVSNPQVKHLIKTISFEF